MTDQTPEEYAEHLIKELGVDEAWIKACKESTKDKNSYYLQVLNIIWESKFSLPTIDKEKLIQQAIKALSEGMSKKQVKEGYPVQEFAVGEETYVLKVVVSKVVENKKNKP